jgi:signal transduction histidine kinase
MKIKCLDFGVAVCGYAAQRGERIVVEDIQNISNPRAHIIRSYGIQAYACHPLLSQGNVLGTLSFGTKNRTSFTSDELEFMKTITDQVATAMQRIINENALQESRLALEKKAAEVEKYAANMESLAEERARKLRDSERLAAIGATAGMVGHDLRNPLQAVIGEVYLAKSELEEMPESKQKTVLKECVDAIAEQVNYMDKIVSDLQTFVKPVEFYKQEVNLKQLVMSVLAQISIPQSILTNLHIDSTLIMNTDPQLLKRVLINLITNAVQAMPEGGNLDIKAQTNDIEHVEIVVEDTGTGIPDEIKPKIFTPLFTTKSKGQGFGLAACKRVIEAQGGTITFESQEGKGTKFILSLPRD